MKDVVSHKQRQKSKMLRGLSVKKEEHFMKSIEYE